MNADRLLAHYEKIADAPDAIGRLRRFVLDLAVRGKLTDYELKKDEVTTLGQIAEFIMGQAPPGNSYNERGEGTVFVKVGEFGERFPEHRAWTTQPLKFAREGDVLICVVGATIGKLNLGIECAIGRSVAAIRPAADVDQVFLFYSLMPFTLRLREDARGTAQGVISRPDLNKIAIWLPPLTEQRRIVAKVDELMALCDRLEAARAAREATRDRLTAASLARLNAPDPQTFRDDARFALDNFPALTARADQIKQLRQTILNLAVRGKLGGSTEGDLKPVGAYRSLQNGYAFKSGWFSKQGIRLLRNANIGHGKIRWDDTVFLPAERKNEFERFLLNEGDIVLTLDRPFIVTGTKVARITAADLPSLLLQRVGRFVETASGLSDDYLFMWVNSPHFNEQIDPGRSNGVPHISSKQVETAEIFVPPLAEQRRIVAKVDELMALCDRLEASLATANETRRRLLEALLAEALASGEARELEAAE
jgi:type I restriction enzyme S subunit